MQKIDVVYILGKGSPWANNELRYSLRSIKENLKGYRNIYIIGELPVWINGVIHIPYPDRFPGLADANITMKVLRACAIPEISKNFLFINDDHLIMKPVEASKIPNFHKGEMINFNPKYFETNVWRSRLRNTMKILIKKGYTTYHYDCHTPIIFNKHKFVEVFDKFDFTTAPGYTMKSIYGNVAEVTPRQLNGEKKTLFKHRLHTVNLERMNSAEFISFNDMGLNEDLKYSLYLRFPNKSKFENMEIEKSTKQAIIEWLEAGESADYEEGVRLYCLIGKNRHLISKFQKDKVEKWRKKLIYQLERISQRAKVKHQAPKVQEEAKKTNQEQSEGSGSQTKVKRPRIIDEDAIKFDALPEELQHIYALNKKELTPMIGSLKAELLALDENPKNDQERARIREDLLQMEDKRRKGWEQIDTWYQAYIKGEEPTKPKAKKPAVNKMDLEQIEAIENADERALLKIKRADANKRYIIRNKAPKTDRKIAELKKRKAELDKMGVEY